jgi:5-methylcytosine-specific restriction endonuclease McrA
MKAPKSSIRHTIRNKAEHRGRHNRDLYNSHYWRKFRSQVLAKVESEQTKQILESNIDESIKVRLLDRVPLCATCLRLVFQGAYDHAESAKVLDHVVPLNPENYKDTKDYFGQAYDTQNVQPLCDRHHGKKSQRDKGYIARAPT